MGLGVILETQALKCYKLCILLKRRKENFFFWPLVLSIVPSVLIIIDIQVKWGGYNCLLNFIYKSLLHYITSKIIDVHLLKCQMRGKKRRGKKKSTIKQKVLAIPLLWEFIKFVLFIFSFVVSILLKFWGWSCVSDTDYAPSNLDDVKFDRFIYFFPKKEEKVLFCFFFLIGRKFCLYKAWWDYDLFYLILYSKSAFTLFADL